MATILIVDAHVLNRQFLLALLGFGRHRLLEAADGADGLLLARSARPDLSITGIMMPRMDGYQFVTRLRAEPALCAIPVMCYTSTYSLREANAMARACAVRKVLQKPSAPEVIRAGVHELLGLPAWQPPQSAAVLPLAQAGLCPSIERQLMGDATALPAHRWPISRPSACA